MMIRLTHENVQAVCDELCAMLDGWVFTWSEEIDGHRCSVTELRVKGKPSIARRRGDSAVAQLLFYAESVISGREHDGISAGVEIRSHYDTPDNAPHYQFRELSDGVLEFVVTQGAGGRRVVCALRQQFRLTRDELMKHVRIH